MMQIRVKKSLTNGRYVTLKNIDKIFAVGSKPCTNVKGVPAIEKAIAETGQYLERWKIVKEDAGPDRQGYIFREINHGCGINGHAKTIRELIWRCADYSHIKIVFEP